LRKLYGAYKERAIFVFVYITEGPHPWHLPALQGVAESSLIDTTNWLGQVRHGIRSFNLPFPCLVDTRDHVVEKAYGGFPERLVIVDARCRIALDEGIGVLSPAWNYQRIEACLKNYPSVH
jgi:hypothetical protein